MKLTTHNGYRIPKMKLFILIVALLRLSGLTDLYGRAGLSGARNIITVFDIIISVMLSIYLLLYFSSDYLEFRYKNCEDIKTKAKTDVGIKCMCAVAFWLCILMILAVAAELVYFYATSDHVQGILTVFMLLLGAFYCYLAIDVYYSKILTRRKKYREK